MYFPFGILVAGIISGMVLLDFIYDFHPLTEAFFNYYYHQTTNTAPTKHVINVVIVSAVVYIVMRLLTSSKKLIYTLFVGTWRDELYFLQFLVFFAAALAVFVTQVETRKAELIKLQPGKDDAALRTLQQGIGMYHAVILGICMIMAVLDHFGVQKSEKPADKKK